MCYAHCLVRKKIVKALLIFAANSALETTDVTSTKENIVLFQSSFLIPKLILTNLNCFLK